MPAEITKLTAPKTPSASMNEVYVNFPITKKIGVRKDIMPIKITAAPKVIRMGSVITHGGFFLFFNSFFSIRNLSVASLKDILIKSTLSFSGGCASKNQISFCFLSYSHILLDKKKFSSYPSFF